MTDYDVDGFFTNAPPHYGFSFTKTVHQTVSPAIDPSKVSFPEGYTVLITGAGKGIGEFIAKSYASAKATNIIITARTASDLDRVRSEITTAHGNVNVVTCPGDATDVESYRKLKLLLEEKFAGRLDCLVCNAGGADIDTAWSPTIPETDPADFEMITKLNYLGPYFAARELIPLMLRNGSGGTIVNVSSAAAWTVGMPVFSYNIAKLALNRLTEVLAATHEKDGLVAFAVHPGGVVTPGAEKRAPQILHILKDDIGMCGAVSVWLSNERPEWLSGRYISSGWDMEELKGMKDEIVKGDKLKVRMIV